MTIIAKAARPLDPRDVVRRVATVATSASTSGALPRVRIDTGNVSYVGAVLGCEEHAMGQYVVLSQAGPQGSRTTTLAYLDLRAPFSISVEDAEAWPTVVHGGDAARWSTDAPLSALEGKRALLAAGAAFTEMSIAFDAGPDLIASGDPRAANNGVRDLVEALRAYVAGLEKDEVGRAARAAIKAIEVRKDSRAGAFAVVREGGALRVRFDPESGMPSQEELQKQLDAAL